VEVLDGLFLGEVVVTSGNFLIASETRLKTGIDQW
jgi:Cu(I)/Ag(I) efflux system membrane fusion protein